MLLRAIAVDYDGTIADNGILNPHIREAIVEARATGLYVVIVTGRILWELRRVAGDLTFVDGVVAENGAVLLLSNGHRRLLGPPPFPLLLHELSSRGLEFVVGRCLVDMDADHAGPVLAIIRDNNLPLTIAFNNNRMMVLPRSISKASGLVEILNILGTSIHNTIGIGNAENDYELIRECEYGVAVDWAPEFLKHEADYVIPGNHIDGVADYIRQVSVSTRLPTRGARQRSFTLESRVGQASFEISNRGRNILITGDSKSGKSWIAGLFCEQLILQRYTVMVIDPEGDHGSLAYLPNTLMLGAGNPLPEMDGLLSLMRQGLSLILNFSHLDHQSKTEYIRKLLPLAANYRRHRGYPHSILIDECHYFLDKATSPDILDQELGSYILVSYQPSLLDPAILHAMGVLVTARITQKQEIDALLQAFGPQLTESCFASLASLDMNEAALLPPTDESDGRARIFRIVPRLSRHIRHRNKYFDLCLQQDQAFVFTREGVPTGNPVHSLHDLTGSVEGMADEVIMGHLQRHDFSRWIERVFNDDDLALSIRNLETSCQEKGCAAGFATRLFEVIQEKYHQNSAVLELNMER